MLPVVEEETRAMKAQDDNDDDDEEEVFDLRKAVQGLWSDTGRHQEAAAELWSRYRSASAPLAQRLCEQLRLVLEPLVASKLAGDYRSGKRINM